MNDFSSLIRTMASKYRIPPALLLAQVWQESKGDPMAVSKCGAAGLMQLMPDTARTLGLMVGDHVDERFNPYVNVDAGTRYLKDQFDHFPEIPDEGERWKFSLASYNGGRGHINDALREARLRVWGDAKDMRPERWQIWIYTAVHLYHCDSRQITEYVSKIWAKKGEYELESQSTQPV